MAYRELIGSFWKPQKDGDQVEGLYINKEEHVGQNDSKLYSIERLDNHEIVQIWGTTVLDNRMSLAKIGQQLKITYKGLGQKGKGGKQAPHIWKVEVEDDIVEAAKKEFDVK
jgi:hypothetical protein